MLYFCLRECEWKKVIVVPNLPYFLTFSPLFYGMETMCRRNHHTNRSFKLAWFEGEKDGRSKVCEILFTRGWAEVVFLCYRADRGADRLAGWLIVPGGSAPESQVAKDKAHRHP